MKLELWYPAKPYRVNQKYGIYRPEVYSQFGFTQHNGVDIQLGADKTVYAEMPCTVWKTLWQEKGGGLVLTVISDREYTFKDGITCHVLIDYLHLERYLVNAGNAIFPVGTKLAIADNTGFSTGPHTHVQYRRVYKQGDRLSDVDKNQANNSFDPEEYRNGFYAVDAVAVVSAYETIIKQLRQILSLLTK